MEMIMNVVVQVVSRVGSAIGGENRSCGGDHRRYLRADQPLALNAAMMPREPGNMDGASPMRLESSQSEHRGKPVHYGADQGCAED